MMRPAHQRQAGFTIVEVTLALGLLTVLLTAVFSLILQARAVAAATRRELVALALARARLDELTALQYSTQALAGGGSVELTDYVTDLQGAVPSVGGSGLAPSPADALTTSRAGYVDHLDESGRWVGATSRPPANAVFTRRWSIARVALADGDAVLLQVIVVPTTMARRVGPLESLQQPGLVRLVAARARRAS